MLNISAKCFFSDNLHSFCVSFFLQQEPMSWDQLQTEETAPLLNSWTRWVIDHLHATFVENLLTSNPTWRGMRGYILETNPSAVKFVGKLLIRKELWEAICLLILISWALDKNLLLNPIALRKAKIVYNFGLSECNRVKVTLKQSDRMYICKLKKNCFIQAVSYLEFQE